MTIPTGPRDIPQDRRHPWWVVMYGDKAKFSSEDGEATEAPPWDVQGIAVPHERVGAHILYAGDYYIWKGDAWFGVDFMGLMDWLINELKVVKIGRAGTYKEWEEILEWMTEEGKKNARVMGEPYKIERVKVVEEEG